jgi:hypothetical protein
VRLRTLVLVLSFSSKIEQSKLKITKVYYKSKGSVEIFISFWLLVPLVELRSTQVLAKLTLGDIVPLSVRLRTLEGFAPSSVSEAHLGHSPKKCEQLDLGGFAPSKLALGAFDQFCFVHLCLRTSKVKQKEV